MGKKRTRTKKTAKPRANRKMPHLSAALLCESVLVEKDDLVSLIRTLDTIELAGKETTLPPGIFRCYIYIAFKSGEAVGKRSLRIVAHHPDGKETDVIAEKDLEFEGNEQGASATAQANIPVKNEGLLWFDVLLNNELMTKIPLRVRYRQVRK